MGEVVFMGTAKIFLKNLPIWGLTLHFYTASFLSAISTPDANFLIIKKPIEFSQRAKSSACLISEAGAVVLNCY
jgi:hypothetical protein